MRAILIVLVLATSANAAAPKYHGSKEHHATPKHHATAKHSPSPKHHTTKIPKSAVK